MKTKKIKPRFRPLVTGFIAGHLEALRGSLGKCISLADAHQLPEVREALLEASYAINRADNALRKESDGR